MNLFDKEIEQKVFLKAKKLVFKLTGITIAEHKKNLLQGRLRKRMRALCLDSYEAYLSYVETNPHEVEHFINVVTTNETFFFRTDRVWDYFQNTFLKDWQKNNTIKKMKIWSAASSSGEEAYTIAICCFEFQRYFPDFDFEINASDISTDVLKTAQVGIFQKKSIEYFKSNQPDRFNRYFSLDEDSNFRIDERVKRKVNFFSHNLFNEVNVKHYDIIFLRNVLIYFDKMEQEKVLIQVEKALSPAGILVLGESETLNGLSSNFHFTAPCIYRRGGALE